MPVKLTASGAGPATLSACADAVGAEFDATPLPMNVNSSRSNRSFGFSPGRPRNVKYSLPLRSSASIGIVTFWKSVQLAVGISVAVPTTGPSGASWRTSTMPPSTPAA